MSHQLLDEPIEIDDILFSGLREVLIVVVVDFILDIIVVDVGRVVDVEFGRDDVYYFLDQLGFVELVGLVQLLPYGVDEFDLLTQTEVVALPLFVQLNQHEVVIVHHDEVISSSPVTLRDRHDSIPH